MSTNTRTKPQLKFLWVLIAGMALTVLATVVGAHEQVGKVVSSLTVGAAVLVYFKVDRPRTRGARGER